MPRQYNIPEIGYQNETGTKDYLIPGSIYLNESIAGTTNLTKSVSDTLTFSDALAGGFGFIETPDTITLTESLSGNYSLSISDTNTLTESLSGNYSLLISDTITLSDAVSFFVASTALTVIVSDAYTLTDFGQPLKLLAGFLLNDDTLSLLDISPQLLSYLLKLVDSESLSDSSAYTLATPVPSIPIYQLLYSGLNDLAS